MEANIITIKNKQQKDYRNSKEITQDAFWNLYDPGTDMYTICLWRLI